MNLRIVYVLFILIGILIGFIFGYSYGSYQTLSLAVDKAQVFLDAEGINITLREDILLSDIFKYKNEIGGCKNALILNDSWN